MFKSWLGQRIFLKIATNENDVGKNIKNGTTLTKKKQKGISGLTGCQNWVSYVFLLIVQSPELYKNVYNKQVEARVLTMN